jgi:hypothetical protein
VTAQEAADDWLAHGLDGRSAKTVCKNRDVLTAVLAVIGRKRLRELTAADVHVALRSVAATRSMSMVAVAHNCLTRLIRYAEARDLVRRNVSALVDTPKGQPGRRSRSLTLDQAVALLGPLLFRFCLLHARHRTHGGYCRRSVQAAPGLTDRPRDEVQHPSGRSRTSSRPTTQNV